MIYGLSFIIGIVLGLLGGGGSILLMPVFVYILGWPTKLSVASSLFVIGIASFFASLSHWRKNNISFRLAFRFAPMAMLGSFIGAKAALFFSDSFQMILFASLLLGASFLMFRKNSNASPQTTRSIYILLVSFCVGILTGLVGVGGGFMIVPALVLLLGASIHVAIGTSLLIISFNSITGIAGYISYVEFPFKELLVFTLLCILGSQFGVYISQYVPQKPLKKGFAVFLLFVSVFILFQNRTSFIL